MRINMTYSQPYAASAHSAVTATLLASFILLNSPTFTEQPAHKTDTPVFQDINDDQTSAKDGLVKVDHEVRDTDIGLSNYLDRVSHKGLIASDMALTALETWEIIKQQTNLPTPVACPGPEGDLLLTWDNDIHHLELEFIPDNTPTFFYLNRDTNEAWEEDYIVGRDLSDLLRIKAQVI